MSMTVGNIGSIYSILSQINKLTAEQNATQMRIATGKRINRASDDPAGLVALNSLNSELVGVNAALSSNKRSQDMLNVADGAITQVSTLVSEIQSLVERAAGASVSASEKAAYQAEIDQHIDAVDRIINAATFNGKSVFNGENRISVITNSSGSIKNLNVYRRNPNVTGNQTLTVSVTAAATRGSAVTTAALATALSAATTIQVTGKLGTATIALAQGMTGTSAMNAIIAQKGVTGVSAAAQGANMALMSNSTGSDSFVSVQILDGSRTWMNAATVNKTSGSDAKVKVNNETANAVGTEVYYTGAGVSLSFNLAKNAVNAGLTVTITGGGATFQLGDSTSSQVNIGLAGINAAELGRSDLGYLADLRSGGSQSLAVSGNNARAIAREASERVSATAARIGSFNKYQIGSAIAMLEVQQEGLTNAIDPIQNADYATETANLTRQQTLMQAAIAALSLANSQQSSILALLR